MKKLSDLSLQITDEEYYANDGTLHHSAISTYARGGFKSIATLNDVKESDALTRGSIVDTLLTDSQESFDNKFIVADIPTINPDIANVIKGLFNIYSETYKSLDDISDIIISETAKSIGLYCNNWSDNTRAKRIRDAGTIYYALLHNSLNKTIVSTSMYNDCLHMVETLRNASNTRFFFVEDNNSNIERVFQPVFRETIDGITYTIKPDELVVLHDKKLIIATDLKTSGSAEYDFPNSFIHWGYSHQSRLYYRVLRQALDKDEYFKDFEISNWYFIVVNKDSLTPLVWEDPDTKTIGTLYYGKKNDIEVKDPFDLAKELQYYLENNSSLPIGISNSEPNNLKEFLNKI